MLYRVIVLFCLKDVAAKKTKPKSMFRRPLSGELGDRLYVMPPLPPTTTTLGAFKSLLLDRLRLLRIAGKFHVDSVLGIPKELQQELNPDTAAVATESPKNEQGRSNSVEVNGSQSGLTTEAGSQIPQPAAPALTRAERQFVVSFPQIIKSELHADHWMRTIRNTHDYQMLRSRFLSLFLWPALLSSVRVEDRGDTIRSRHVTVVASMLGSGRLVVEKNRVAEEDRKVDQISTSPASASRIQRLQYR